MILFGSRGLLSLGTRGERVAARALRKKGYKIVTRNYRCPAGEIDLIGLDGDQIVFVEVKTRKYSDVAFPEANITPHKRGKLTQVAKYYLATKAMQARPCRFDVMAIVLDGRKAPQIEHFINAFAPTPK